MTKKLTKIIGKKKYTHVAYTSSKNFADIVAKEYREKGYLARVVVAPALHRFGSGDTYDVWVRRK